MRVEQTINFYATSSNYSNKLFSFKITSTAAAAGLIQRFIQNHNTIHAIYLNSTSSNMRKVSYKMNVRWFMITNCLIPHLNQFSTNGRR